VQLDSITHNELGDPDMLAHLPPYAPAAAAGPIGECEARMSEASACTGCQSVGVNRSKNSHTRQPYPQTLNPQLVATPCSYKEFESVTESRILNMAAALPCLELRCEPTRSSGSTVVRYVVR